VKPSVLMLLAAASMPLAACASTNDSALASAAPASTAPDYTAAAAAPRDCRSVGGTALTGAAVGGAGGAALGAVTGGVSVLGGALIGAAVGGLAGAVWADANNDGCADGYVREGRYYEGEPGAARTIDRPYRRGERG